VQGEEDSERLSEIPLDDNAPTTSDYKTITKTMEVDQVNPEGQKPKCCFLF